MTIEEAVDTMETMSEFQRESIFYKEILKKEFPDDWEERIAKANLDSSIQNQVTTEMAAVLESMRRLKEILAATSGEGGGIPPKTTDKPH